MVFQVIHHLTALLSMFFYTCGTEPIKTVIALVFKIIKNHSVMISLLVTVLHQNKYSW